MKFLLVGQYGYRCREQFFRQFEAADMLEAKKISHELMTYCLGGEDNEYLGKELDSLGDFQLLEVASQTALDCEDPELEKLSLAVQAEEKNKRQRYQREADERELARIKARLGQV